MVDPRVLCLARMTRRILLATSVNWPSAARLAGAFAAFGCAVEAVFPRGHVLGASRYLARAHLYRPLRPLSSFAAAIKAAEPDLIVPCDDRAVTHLLALGAAAPTFLPLLTRSLGALRSYPTMMRRSDAVAAARVEGVPAPLTIAVANRDELFKALEVVGLPAVLKTDASWGGDHVAVARTALEASVAFTRLAGPPSRLRSLARAMLRKDAHFLHAAVSPMPARVHLQAFVAGKPATSALACRDGEVLGALHMDVVDWQGSTGPAAVIARIDCPFMEAAARAVARRFNLCGLHGIDFIRDAAGVPHLIEINPRATQICHLALGEGHDLPAALLGRPARPMVTDKPLIALYPQAWRDNPQGPRQAFRDVPWDDPAVLLASAGPGFVLEEEALPPRRERLGGLVHS